ncbi:ferredoxin [Pseudofrankia asymbiotica]|uniref:Ferredoxin n=1 Tax=Pseudofrankia asymbiotica TaxID=1834516 RepID=A0A1V2I0H5_9ACTN|nr:ferredoxin [Pseudofrankia asymbiotica]ONH22760.1 hypothetical protein BL253_34785 [Pseudofrankia asymbiotica]
MRKILSIDTTVCKGAGTCGAMHPQLFSVGDDGYAVARRTDLVDPADIAAAASVVDVCPTEAIQLTSVD